MTQHSLQDNILCISTLCVFYSFLTGIFLKGNGDEGENQKSWDLVQTKVLKVVSTVPDIPYKTVTEISVVGPKLLLSISILQIYIENKLKWIQRTS